MTKTAKILLVCVLLLALAALVFCCIRFGAAPERAQSGDALQTAVQLCAAAETAWRDGTAERITLSDAAGGTVTVTAPGIYRVSGTLQEGQLKVTCDGTVTLLLDGIDISNSAKAAISVSEAAQTMLYLPEGSENRLLSGTEQAITAAEGNAAVVSASGAALSAKGSLFIAGSGALNVGGYCNNAVAAADHLIVLNGSLDISAVKASMSLSDVRTNWKTAFSPRATQMVSGESTKAVSLGRILTSGSVWQMFRGPLAPVQPTMAAAVRNRMALRIFIVLTLDYF